jgi:hypothetical protein
MKCVCACQITKLYIYISRCVYITLYKKNQNILQIYLYNINIFFGSGSSEFPVCFDNIHTLLITY